MQKVGVITRITAMAYCFCLVLIIVCTTYPISCHASTFPISENLNYKSLDDPISNKIDGSEVNLSPYTLSTPGAPPLQVLHGTTTISFTFKDGIICAVDSRASMGNYVGSKTTQKVLPVSKTILGTMAGGAADCTYFLRWLRSKAAVHELEYGTPMSVARASRILSNALYENRQLQLSVGTMIMGFDEMLGDVKGTIYYVDNTGLRVKGDMFAIGSGSTFAIGILDTIPRKERENMGEEEAVSLAISAIRHATYRDAYSGGYIGVYVIKPNEWKKVFSEDLAMASDFYRRKKAYMLQCK